MEFLHLTILLIISFAAGQKETPKEDSITFHHDHGCSIGEFPCARSSKCLAQRYWCDDVKDCPEGDDEDERNCGEKTSGFGRNFLRRMVDSSEQDGCIINEPSIGKARMGCEIKKKPHRCVCMGHNIRCDNLSLTQVFAFDEEMVDPNSPVYSFSRNRIQYLHDNIFSLLPKLHQLDFRRNAISGLNIRAFTGLTELRRLHLDNNKIQKLDPRAFWPLNHLCFLWLGQNQIQNWEPNIFNNSRLRWLDLKANKITLEPGMFHNLNSLFYLELEMNEIKQVSKAKLNGLTGLYYLDLSSNQIEKIDEDSFEATPVLEELSLADNLFTEIPERLFTPMPNLQFLNLSNNPGLKSLPMDIFRGLTKIDRLNLSGITICNIHREMFDDIPSNALVIFSKFHYCYYCSHILDCVPKSDGISSSENLIELVQARTIIWVLIALVPLSNLFVLIATCVVSAKDEVSLPEVPEMYHRHEHKVMKKFRYNLFISNSLMTIYLLIIAIYDIEFRENYHREAYEWLHGWICPIAGLTVSLSIFLPLITLVTIILDRTICILYYPKYPIGRRWATGLLTFYWLFGLLIFGIPIGVWDNVTGSFYGNNGLCIPLYLDEPYLNGWWYSSLLFFGIFVISVGITTVCAIKLNAHTRSVEFEPEECALDLLVARRYFIIVTVNLVCWIPVIVIKIMAFTPLDISNLLHSVFAVLILPLNGFLTPVLHVYLSTDFRRNFAKIITQGYGGHADCFRMRSDSDFKPESRVHSMVEGNGTLSLGRRGYESRNPSPVVRPLLRNHSPSPEATSPKKKAFQNAEPRPRSC